MEYTDYIVLPTCTTGELSALAPVGMTPFQDAGYCRIRVPTDTVVTSPNIIPAPEGFYELPNGEMLGVFA